VYDVFLCLYDVFRGLYDTFLALYYGAYTLCIKGFLSFCSTKNPLFCILNHFYLFYIIIIHYISTTPKGKVAHRHPELFSEARAGSYESGDGPAPYGRSP